MTGELVELAIEEKPVGEGVAQNESVPSQPARSWPRPAINQWLQYRARAAWRDHLHGERVHIALILIAKSLLAWQIFANVRL